MSRLAEQTVSPRRHLSGRQARTVGLLLEAALSELTEVGYDALTVRGVARRAGVAPATAYTYFGSKEHLVAEVFWRRYARDASPEDTARHGTVTTPGTPASRAASVLGEFAMVADEPELAAACTVALLANDPEVRDLRLQIGTETRRRLVEALGDDADPLAVQTLLLATSGALLQAGTGHLAYDAVPALLADVARLVLT
ncbi:MAG: helix-turn-helix transcriptional regulator [Acidimicrobiales bacterium]|nr:helix-turn-helix transcriptional regulator [Acidimicrobiales bacterium]